MHKLFKNWAKDVHRQLTEEDTEMANKYWKRGSISYVITEL